MDLNVKSNTSVSVNVEGGWLYSNGVGLGSKSLTAPLRPNVSFKIK